MDYRNATFKTTRRPVYYKQSTDYHHLSKVLKCHSAAIGACSFICQQGTLTRKQQRKDLFGLWVKLPSVTTCLTTQRLKQSR